MFRGVVALQRQHTKVLWGVVPQAVEQAPRIRLSSGHSSHALCVCCLGIEVRRLSLPVSRDVFDWQQVSKQKFRKLMSFMKDTGTTATPTEQSDWLVHHRGFSAHRCVFA